MITSGWILLERETFQTNVVEKIKIHILSSISSPPPSARQGSNDKIIQRLSFVCCITKATDTHSEYAIIIVLPRQPLLRERVCTYAVRLPFHTECHVINMYISQHIFFEMRHCGSPLDEVSTTPKALYMTTHETHKRQTSIPSAVFDPTIPASESQ